MPENVNRLFTRNHDVPVLRINRTEASPTKEREPRIREALANLGIKEPVRLMTLNNVTQFPQNDSNPDDGDTRTAVVATGIIVVVSLALGAVLAYLFYL